MATNMPASLDAFTNPNASGGDNLNTSGVLHDGQHTHLNDAMVQVERIVVGPTYYNVAGYPQSTFDARFAAALADAHSGGGTVVVNPGAYTTTGLGTITKPTVSVWGPGGATGTVITRTAGASVLTFAPSPLGTAQMGVLKGIKIVGDATSSIIGVRCLDTGVLPGFEDVIIANFTGGGAIGLSLENNSTWNERGRGNALSLENNTIGMRLNGSGSANSFFYHRWADLRLNIGASQIGIQASGTALLQGGKWVVLANINGNGGIVFDVGASAVVGGDVYITGEQTSGTGGIARRIAGIWAATGITSVNGCTDSITGDFWPIYEVNGAGRIYSDFPAVPTVAAGAAAGTSPPAPTIQGNDLSGIVGIGTGTATVAGNLLTVTFNQPYAHTPIVTISPFGVSSGTYRPFISAVSTTAFTIALVDPPATGLTAGALSFFFHVIG